MKYLNSYQLYEVLKLKNEFWQDIDKVVKELMTSDNFSPFWSLAEKYPKFVDRKSVFHDAVIVPLHNHNKVKKRMHLEDKILMFITEVFGYGKSQHIIESLKSYPDFKTWFENAILKVYRGIPDYKKLTDELQITENTYRSFTLDKETALKFTQAGWAAKARFLPEDRNGYILEGEIKPFQIHIFQNEGHEEECVIKGPFKCSKYYIVKNNQIAKKPSSIENLMIQDS